MFRNISFFVASAFLFCQSLAAQDVFDGVKKQYVRISAGYGMKAFQENLTDRFFLNGRLTIFPAPGLNLESVNTSFGKGFYFNAGYCYMINKNIGFDAGLTLLAGAKQSADINIFVGELSQTYQGQLLEFTPSLVLAQNYGKAQIYSRMGFILAMGRINYETISNIPSLAGLIGGGTPNFSFDNTDVQWRYSGGLATGVNMTVGFSRWISNRLDVFAELSVSALTYAPTKGKVLSDQFNGKNALDTMTTSQKQVEFKSSIAGQNLWSSTVLGSVVASQLTGTSNPNQPSEDLLRKYPFGSVGVLVGVRIKI